MNLAQRLNNVAKGIEDKQQAVLNEIVDYFRNELTTEKYEKILEEKLSKESVAKKREYEFVVEYFTDYMSYLSIKALYTEWTNPDYVKGEYVYIYKGVNLNDIKSDIVSKLVELSLELLANLGFEDIVYTNEKLERTKIYIHW